MLGVRLKHFFSRYHYTLFLVIAVGGIVMAIYSLLAVVSVSSDTSNFTQSETYAPDMATIEKIKQLNTVSDSDYKKQLEGQESISPF